MKFSIYTSYGSGNEQALSICKKIAVLDPPTEEILVFDFTGYGENNPFSNLILINTLRKYRKDHSSTIMRCAPKASDK